MGYDMYAAHVLDAVEAGAADTADLFADEDNNYLRRSIWGIGALREALIVTGAGFDVAEYGFASPNAWLGIAGEDCFAFPDPADYGLTPTDEGLAGDRLDEFVAAQQQVLTQHGPRDVPGIPVYPKLASNDGWWVTKIECQAAVAIIGRWLADHGSSPEQAIAAVRDRDAELAQGGSCLLPLPSDDEPAMTDEEIILELGEALPFLRNAAAHEGFRVY